MAQAYEQITEPMRRLLDASHVFFVATAPGDGHVNVSPKGYDTFRVIDATRVAYLDLTGSGAETIAHLRDNGRITIMVCAFEGPPNVVRLYGTGRVVVPGDHDFDELASLWEPIPGARAVIDIALQRTSTSCGYSIPFMDYAGERDRLIEWAEAKSDGLEEYRATNNAESIDGLPALGT